MAIDKEKYKRLKARTERRRNRINRRKNINAIKGDARDSLGILQIILFIILLIVVMRILMGVNNGTFTFAEFFQSLISFEGVNMEFFINNLSPLEIIFGEDLPNWIQAIGNAIGKVVNPLGMILGCLINATWFIGHCLVILFGI